MTLVLLILTLLFARLAWQNLKLGTLVLVGILPVYLLRLEIAGIPSTILEIFIWILVFAWILRGLKDHAWKFTNFRASLVRKSPFRSLRFPITLLLIAALVSTFTAPDLFSALGILKAYYIEPLLVFMLVVSLFDRKDLPSLFTSLGLSVLVLSLFAFFQKITGFGIPIPWDTARRVTSIFPYPNALGLFLAPTLAAAPFLLAKARRDDNVKQKTLWSLVLLFGVGAIVFSQTHAAWLAIPVATFLATLIPSSKKARRLSLSLTAIVAVLFFALLTPSIDFSNSTSVATRLSQWQETSNYLIDNHWLLGAGLSGYPSAIELYHQDLQFEIFQYPHNIFLNFWVELGLLGLIAFIWLGLNLGKLIKQHKNNIFVLATSAALMEILLHGLVDVPYLKNDLAVLTWILVSVLTIISKPPKKTLSP